MFIFSFDKSTHVFFCIEYARRDSYYEEFKWIMSKEVRLINRVSGEWCVLVEHVALLIYITLEKSTLNYFSSVKRDRFQGLKLFDELILSYFNTCVIGSINHRFNFDHERLLYLMKLCTQLSLTLLKFVFEHNYQVIILKCFNFSRSHSQPGAHVDWKLLSDSLRLTVECNINARITVMAI